MKSILVVSLFFTLNISLNLLNRYALGVRGFSFPISLTLFQALAMSLCLFGSCLVSRSVKDGMLGALGNEWRGIIWVGFWTSANILLNNISLVYISLSLNQVIRSSIPLVTAVVSSVHDKKVPTRVEIVGLLVLCGGVGVAIGEASVNGNALGVLTCLSGVISGAYMLYSTSRTLHDKFSSFQLAFLTAPITVFCLSPPFYIFEFERVFEYGRNNFQVTMTLLLSAAAVATLYNVVHNELVHIVGPVTTTVLGQVKIVSLMILSGILFGDGRDFSSKMKIGCFMAVAGLGIYSAAKVKQQLATASRVEKEKET